MTAVVSEPDGLVIGECVLAETAWRARREAHERRVFATFGQTWDRRREPAIYEALPGPDDAPGENDSFGFGRAFPKKTDGGKAEVSPAFFTAFDNSPSSSVVLRAFVQRAVREEKLGRHRGTDLLACVSRRSTPSGIRTGPAVMS